MATGSKTEALISGGPNFLIVSVPNCTTASEVQAYIKSHPLTVWYRSVDFYKCKGPFYYVHEVSDGTESPYKAIGIELNAPLFDGDSLKVDGKSGCDKQIKLDGFAVQVVASGGDYAVSADDAAGPAYASGLAGLTVSDGVIIIPDSSFPASVTDASTANSWLQDNPQTVFYRSTSYSQENDIPVALESHVKKLKLFDGTEDLSYNARGYFEHIIPGDVSSDIDEGPATKKTQKASHGTIANADGRPGSNYYWAYTENHISKIRLKPAGVSDIPGLKSFLSSQHSLGTPVQVVYELATPVSYAHPIQTESLPVYYGTEDFVTALAGEPVTGKWLTFTNDGAQLNFKGGGGVGVSKLAATTAVPADVVQGKTFYSKDKTLKRGTLADKPALNDAVSVGNDGNYLYARIPVGAYRTKQATGYPEIRFPNSDAIKNIPGGDNGAWSGTYSGSNVTIPKGYHNGNGSVGVAGGNKGAWGSTINPGGSVTIPRGYHNGSGVVKANGNSINFHPIDRTVGWGSGVRFTGEDATPGASGKMRFVLKYWCRTEYNVNGYIKVLRNGSEIHSTTFNKNYDSPYNDDVPNGYINVEFSGSGTYQIQVSVDYNAGNGEIKMGGAFIGY